MLEGGEGQGGGERKRKDEGEVGSGLAFAMLRPSMLGGGFTGTGEWVVGF